MTTDPTRRFTDREVAIVLRKAVEIDESEGSGAGGGLSLDDLKEIGREVGITPAAIERAVDRIEGPTRAPALLGAPLTRKAVRAVPGELGEEAIARLVRLVDERTDTTGTISEALGSVRWTGSDRFKSALIAITPGGGETSIEVVEKSVSRVRRIFHFLPAAWGVMVAGPVVAAFASGPLLAVAGAALGAAVGTGLGRVAWNTMSVLSARRVERLASELADTAHGLGKAGMVTDGSGAGGDPDPAADR